MPTRIQEISPGGGRVPAQYFPGVSNSFQGGGVGVQLLFYKETCGFSRVGGLDLLPPSGPAHDLYTCVYMYKAFKM